MTLRGAGVEVDGRRVARIVVSLCLVALAVVVVVLFLSGIHKNDQIARLRQSGVAIDVRVTECRGLMGGSGSNLVGYACRGTFALGGHRYDEAIPGNTFHLPGASLQELTVPGDPALLATVHAVATERASGKVFILPTALLLVLVLLVGVIALKRPRRRSAAPQDAAVTAL
jgi:hypothetical protein